ncbi:MAG: phytanoyl-CoA dioxygenase family protein [Acidimicrobiales bacterium]
MTHHVLEQVETLRDAGRWPDAVDLLRGQLVVSEDLALESAFVQGQHSAFATLADEDGPPEWPPTVPDFFTDHDAIPEILGSELTAEHLASALQHHGSLIVREFIAPDHHEFLRTMIDRAFDAMAAWEVDPEADLSPWFVEFQPDEGYSLGAWERLFVTYGGGVHAVDSPRAWFHVVETLRATGIGDVIAGYLGERPALSAKKTTLRRAGPDCRNGWHQDGAFLGKSTRSVNVWTSLTDSGVDAPGLDVVHRSFEEILETGTEGAQFTWSVSEQLAREKGGDVLERPVFNAGDAMLFDEKTLHQTGRDPETMTKTRYALETWFFAPSTYPHEQIPVCF